MHTDINSSFLNWLKEQISVQETNLLTIKAQDYQDYSTKWEILNAHRDILDKFELLKEETVSFDEIRKVYSHSGIV